MNHYSKIVCCVVALGVASSACTRGVRGHSASVPASQYTTDANITRVTTKILERSQFAHHPLDAQLATKFLDNFLNSLDATHSLFLQADLDSFAPYRATLAQATRASGDTSVERAVVARYLERLQQRASYVAQVLKTEPFVFTGHERFSFDREHAERPRNASAAQAIWHEQLRAEYLQERLSSDAKPEQIATKLAARYARQVRTMKGLDSGEVLDIYLNALAHVYDPHSDYLGHEELDSLSSAMNLSLVGIGASLESVEGYAKIRELLPGGPAALSGRLKPGDRIVAVAQTGKEAVDIGNMPLAHAVMLIRGPKGTGVTLSIIAEGSPDGSVPEKIALVRDEIKLDDEAASARIVDLPTEKGRTLRLGVLDLPSFYADIGDHAASTRRSATADVARLLAKLQSEKVQALILDLRRNGGGSLNEAISLTGLFIHQGPVVQTRGPAGDVEVDSDKDATEQYGGPLIVLTSRLSASASEILTGALQDYGRALVVGDSSTFGKGTVQSILPLAPVMDEAGFSHTYDPGALKVTIRKFYRPSGGSTQLRGVNSDIVLPSTTDFDQVSESALNDPLPWDTLAPVPHEQFNWVAPYVSALRAKSAQRVASEKGFAELQEDAARLKADLTTKSVSLNEAERRQELSITKARAHERDSEDAAAASVRPKTYSIKLQDTSLPGLPPAIDFTTADAAGKASDSADGEPARHKPGTDVILSEAEHILVDYQELSSQQQAAARPAAE
ncbi:MAG: carboxy terminal-processing peptidase [Polyangiaceae bacterium]